MMPQHVVTNTQAADRRDRDDKTIKSTDLSTMPRAQYAARLDGNFVSCVSEAQGGGCAASRQCDSLGWNC